MITSLNEALQWAGQDCRIYVARTKDEAMDLLNGSQVNLLIADLRPTDTSRRAQESRSRASVLHTSPSAGERIPRGEGNEVATEEIHAAIDGRQARQQVASLIGHHLRVPLTFILGYASVATQQIDRSTSQMIHSIVRHAMQLRKVLDDLTPLLEWCLARLPASSYPVDLRHLVAEVVSSLAVRAAERDQVFDFTSGSRPVLVAVDEWGVGTLLTLLLGHLIRRLPEGARLRLHVDRGESGGVVTIEGSEGIRQNEEFEGVSLDTVQAMAEALGGGLDVGPMKSDGVRFVLTFPLQIQARRPSPVEVRGSVETRGSRDGGQACPHRG